MVDNRGIATPYSAGTTGRPLPQFDPTAHLARQPSTAPTGKPSGLDWDAHTPTCAMCRQKSGRIDDTGLCPGCRGVALPAATEPKARGVLNEHQLAEKFAAPTTTPPTINPKAEAFEKDLEELERADQARAALLEPVEGTPAYVKRLRAARAQADSPSPDTTTPPAPTVRAKVRQTSPDDVVITLRGTGLATRTTEIAALLQDLLAGLHQTPVVVAPAAGNPLDRHPATTGPDLAPRTGKGKPDRGASTTSRHGGGPAGSSGKLAGHDEAIIARYQAGESSNEIATDYGCSGAAVLGLLRRNDVTIRPRGGSTDRNHHTTTLEGATTA